jgi:D-alanine transfer protein
MDCQHQPLEHTPHLAPALTAVVLGVAVMAAFGVYARSLEYRSIKALAADEAIIDKNSKLAPVKNQGTALQQAALDTACLLPIFGSSELNVQVAYNRPFHATKLFHDQPTGFTVFPIGKAASTCLIVLQKLAAVGPALQGRKVVISLSPFWFFERLEAHAPGYAGNFSSLHAGELVFNSHLSFPLRQDAARRMLQYPETVANRPLLRFALENMADGSPFNLACYEAVRPLGIAQNAILRNLDHWRVMFYLWQHPSRTSSPTSESSSRRVDWAMLHRQADASYRPYSSNNEFGLDNEIWDRKLRQEVAQQRNARSDEAFLDTLHRNKEWADLELLLRGLTELGARPLLTSMPIHGHWYDQCGITYNARKTYYQELRGYGARYHAAVVDFADHDADRSFCHDTMGHLAPDGLVYYGQLYDNFFHDELPQQPELRVSALVASRGNGTDLSSRPTPGPRQPAQRFHEPSSPTAIDDTASTTNPELTLPGRKGKP